jgi:hypothetical protein
MELEEFKKQIRGGMEWAKQQGIITMRGFWGVWFFENKWHLTMETPTGCCCPLGALLLRDQPAGVHEPGGQHRTNLGTLSEHLGVQASLLEYFIHGVDGNIPPDSDEKATEWWESTEWWEFGVIIRAEIN